MKKNVLIANAVVWAILLAGCAAFQVWYRSGEVIDTYYAVMGSAFLQVMAVESGPVILFAVGALLGLLFVPDKEIALIFTVLLGYYPLVKPRFDRIRPRALQLVCKLLLCNAAVLAMYGLLLVIVPAGSVSQELRTTALAMTLLTLAMGNVAFALYDRALCNMLLLYKLKWQPKLHKMLGMH